MTLSKTTAREFQYKAGQKSQTRVQIYLANFSVSGDIHCPEQRRLLDILNGIPVAVESLGNDFLVLGNAGIQFTDRPEQKLNAAWVNRDDLLFVRELGGRFKGISETGNRAYPYVTKNPKNVIVHMPSYVLAGRLHCVEKKGIDDLLNSESTFVAMTEVDVCPVTGGGLSGIDFIAVNKKQILLVLET